MLKCKYGLTLKAKTIYIQCNIRIYYINYLLVEINILNFRLILFARTFTISCVVFPRAVWGSTYTSECGHYGWVSVFMTSHTTDRHASKAPQQQRYSLGLHHELEQVNTHLWFFRNIHQILSKNLKFKFVNTYFKQIGKSFHSEVSLNVLLCP